MPRSVPSFTMRFEVTNPLMTEGQKAEATVKRKAPTLAAALVLGRAALEAKGFTVGACTDCRTKLQSHNIGVEALRAKWGPSEW